MIRKRRKAGFKSFPLPKQIRSGLDHMNICIDQKKLHHVGSKNTMHISYSYVCHSPVFLLLHGLG